MNEPLDLTRTLLDWSGVFMRRSMRDFMQYTRQTGFSITQMNVLMHLYYRGPGEVKSIVEVMQVSPAASSQIVERMVQQGLVSRVESASDRRVRQVNVTAEGRKIVEQSIAARRKWMESLMTALSDDQKNAIASALQILTENALRLEKGEQTR